MLSRVTADVYVHVQLMKTVDLWDYLLQGKCLEGCRGCRVGEGGLGAHVVWSLGMTTWRNKRLQQGAVTLHVCTCTCTYMHMVEDHETPQ